VDHVDVEVAGKITDTECRYSYFILTFEHRVNVTVMTHFTKTISGAPQYQCKTFHSLLRETMTYLLVVMVSVVTLYTISCL
jgi:hypothetical protein